MLLAHFLTISNRFLKDSTVYPYYRQGFWPYDEWASDMSELARVGSSFKAMGDDERERFGKAQMRDTDYDASDHYFLTGEIYYLGKNAMLSTLYRYMTPIQP